MKSGVTIVRKKQGMKSLIKKLVELQHFGATVGIHSGVGSKLVRNPDGKPRKSKFNVAMLARNMETNATWIQSETVVKDFGDGTMIMFEAGRRYHRKARHFVSLIEIPDYWGKLKSFLTQQVKLLVIGTGMRPRSFIKNIGSMASSLQRSVITSAKAPANAKATEDAKGFNHPLFWTGNNLLKSLDFKIISDKNGLGQSGRDALKISDANLVDDLIKKINRK